MSTTLAQLRREVTADQLGDCATAEHVREFRDLLTDCWPAGAVSLSDVDADQVAERAWRLFCGPREIAP